MEVSMPKPGLENNDNQQLVVLMMPLKSAVVFMLFVLMVMVVRNVHWNWDWNFDWFQNKSFHELTDHDSFDVFMMVMVIVSSEIVMSSKVSAAEVVTSFESPVVEPREKLAVTSSRLPIPLTALQQRGTIRANTCCS
ncbi:unnamed protein product [Acanthoscelides obtectus]|uniref:Transmembrane protein n=1 Tax=Acanthoscelides obtectus TaxID=200917 RepID=A0A9P0NUP7_ACAOB|nr:unnamed protein product [Acanthoscelides obtectus]CAK1678482.1 hypothetical protein AOBTE_LOCUS31929 [Acanthoscelides obtectus]